MSKTKENIKKRASFSTGEEISRTHDGQLAGDPLGEQPGTELRTSHIGSWSSTTDLLPVGILNIHSKILFIQQSLNQQSQITHMPHTQCIMNDHMYGQLRWVVSFFVYK
ncbi:hypothetical protein Tcan_17564 [Toxocara canis]|uniref:Uncharacterized protein n=1 Tax=Toxocara canis TaxID=6265 RepID=A0A0B2UT64_TOXCA|nr:hypothetical protein Tcan_17564 [Toxocara canis]